MALLVIKGNPAYEPVEGTRLSRIVNTDARFFVHRPKDRIYVHLGGRWLRAASFKGPWEPVAPAALPYGLENAATRNH